MWAQALALSPEDVLERLAQARIDNAHGETLSFAIDNGALTSLVWDFDALPLAQFEWVDGLQIRQFGFQRRDLHRRFIDHGLQVFHGLGRVGQLTFGLGTLFTG